MKNQTIKSTLQLFAIVISCSFLQGCILLLPVIENNQAAERKLLAEDHAKTCPLTDGLGLSPDHRFDSMAEAQAFVAAHQSAKRTTPNKRRRVKMSKAMRVAMLVKQLRSGSEVSRTHAATDLGRMGKSAKGAIDDLSNSLRYDESKWVRRAAVKSLAKISGNSVVAPLTFALNDNNPWVVHSAKNALRKVRRELGNGSAGTVQLKPVVYRAN